MGPNSHSVSGVEALESLPRHELSRVAANIGVACSIRTTREEYLEAIRRHVEIDGNCLDDGRVTSQRGRAPRVTPAPSIPSSSGSSVDSAIGAVVRSTVLEVLETLPPRGDALDLEAIEGIVNRVVDARVNQTRQVIINGIDRGRITGKTHRDFEELLTRVSARVNMFLTGEAGVGKSHMAKQIARTLDLPLVTTTAKPLPQDFEILGGVTPIDRKVMKGAVRDIYEHGGLWLLDEIDSGHVSLSTALNDLLSGDSFHFDIDGGGKVEVEKHKDFVVLATGNTFGQGGNLRYMGTTRMNGAGLNRFAFFHVECDEMLTRDVMIEKNRETGEKVHRVWTQCRRNIERYNLDYLMTPRQAFMTQEFMLEGLSIEKAARGVIYGRGLAEEQERKVLEGISWS